MLVASPELLIRGFDLVRSIWTASMFVRDLVCPMDFRERTVGRSEAWVAGPSSNCILEVLRCFSLSFSLSLLNFFSLLSFSSFLVFLTTGSLSLSERSGRMGSVFKNLM
eukprot:TRINITY_DN5391_c0_g2_i1.p2 TRINITY_DN5391_c0_g2~~TRINITY_DN5391_c0_g2_i1.p2  ORF type:complete len:109 (+),score=3.08 TRINITY_DN5391_c0_g2_i1:91-417(+)